MWAARPQLAARMSEKKTGRSAECKAESHKWQLCLQLYADLATLLKIPLEYVKQSVAAGNVSPVRDMAASSEADVAKSPEVKDASSRVLHGSHQDSVQSSHGCTCYLHNGKTCAHMNLTNTSKQCSSMVLSQQDLKWIIVCIRYQARLMDRVQERQQVQVKKSRQR